ncbi:FtsX-like permease family protein [Planotetraspora thailandica]|nr:FtsX-like permease family protein [Planotetraspora thailandica]
MALGRGGRTLLVLRRASSEPLLLLGAFGSVLLATTTLVALIMYAMVVAEVGVQRAMETAPQSVKAATVTSPVSVDDLQEIDATVRAHLREAYGGMPSAVTLSISSDSYAMPGQEHRQQPELTRFATYEGIERQTRLVTGAWPEAGDGLEVAISQPAAQAMRLSVGDDFTVVGRLNHQPVRARVVGLFELYNPYDDRWRDDQLLRRGVETGDYTTYGPLVVAQDAFLRRFATSVRATWLAVPDLRELPRDGLRPLATSVTALGDGLQRDCGTCTTFTRLPEMLGQLDQAALVARSTMLVPVLQLLLLAAYALMLTARLLADHRRMELALLRSRGASTVRLALLAGGEALLVALPSAVIAPLLAPWVLAATNAIPWIQASGVRLSPATDATSFLVAAAVALASAVLLALPALRGARRTYVEEQSARGRGDRQGLIQRAGADIALLVVAALAIWQLGRYGAPVTSTAGGGLGVDPLIVAGPALALLCGGMLGLRLVPVVSRVAERMTARRRGLAPALGVWQVSRRPLRYAGPALLLTMAIAIGVVSLATAATWRRSQEDQARHQAGADLRIATSVESVELGTLGRGAVYAALPGVTGLAPVRRETVDFAGAPASLLAVDADRLDGLLLLRRDLAPPVSTLARELAAARPQAPPIPIPGEPRALSLRVRLALTPPGARHGDIRLRVVIRDALGATRELASDPLETGDHEMRVDLTGLAGRSGRLALPLAVQGLLVDAPDPGRVGEVSLAVDGLRTDAGTEVALPGEWTAWTDTDHRQVALGGFTAQVPGPSGRAPSLDEPGAPLRLALVPGGSPSSASRGASVPVVITADLARRSGLRVGAAGSITMSGVPTPVVPVAVVPALPGTAAGEPALLADLPTLAYRDLIDGRAPGPAAEWWLAVRGGDTSQAAAELARHPEWDQTVVDRAALTRQLRDDPLASGLQGALVLGFLSALVFALLGFLVNAAVAARERTAEFALLRAIGVSHRQVFGLLAVEQAFIITLSLATGTVLAVVVAVLVVPHIVLTGQATAVTPAVLLDIPWLPTAALLTAVAAVLFCIVAGLAGRLRRQGLGRVLRIREG